MVRAGPMFKQHYVVLARCDAVQCGSDVSNARERRRSTPDPLHQVAQQRSAAFVRVNQQNARCDDVHVNRP